MKIIKTAHFDQRSLHMLGNDDEEMGSPKATHHEPSIEGELHGEGAADDMGDKASDIFDDLTLPGDDLSNPDDSHENNGHAVLDVPGMEHLDPELDELFNMLGGEHGADDSDLGVSMHLDAPNDLGGELPVDIDVDPSAMEHGEDYGDFDQHDDSRDFDNLAFDGKLDGDIDFGDTNDTKPDADKHPLDPHDDFDDSDFELLDRDFARRQHSNHSM
jgi:hypothetical protein